MTTEGGEAGNGPLSPTELERIDAYWRAANYLSVGQIYLLDNPLLARAAAARAHQAAPARPLGHHAGPELHLRPHEPRHQELGPRRDLRHRARATAARRSSPTRTSREPTARSTRASRGTRTGMRRLFRQFSLPGRHPQPRRARRPRLDPRGRRARLRALPRLRRGVRQPRPRGLLRRRRRRGRDRAARHELALEQVPQPGPRRRRAADPPPQRLQDRQPDRAGAHPARTSCAALLEGYGYTPYFVEGDDPAADAPADGGDAGRGHRARSTRSSERRASAGKPSAPALADDRPADARRAGPGRRRSTACPSEGTWRSHQVPLSARFATNPEHLALLEEWMRSYRPEELFDADGALMPGARRAAAQELPADEREPARERRAAAAGPRAAGLPRLRRRRARRRAARRPRRRACSARSCATSCDAQPPTTSGSSARTRRPPTGSARCSR